MTIDNGTVPVVIEFFVRGTPKPKGSPRPIRNQHTGKTTMVIDSDAARTWGQAIAGEAARARGLRAAPLFLSGVPVAVGCTFVFQRRKGDLRSDGRPKPKAPHFHTTYPDIDKLWRVVLDALKHGGMFHDDSQVAAILPGEAKVYGDEPGVWIRLKPIEQPEVKWYFQGDLDQRDPRMVEVPSENRDAILSPAKGQGPRQTAHAEVEATAGTGGMAETISGNHARRAARAREDLAPSGDEDVFG